MGRFGLGFGTARGACRRSGGGTPTPTPTPVPLVAPGGAWNGTAQSGYSGSPPTTSGSAYSERLQYGNMVGTVAPIAHFIQPVVTDEPFTADYTVVVSAFAASSTGIVGGIASVDFYVEGTTQNVATLGVYDVPAYGGTVPVLGYAITLDHSAFAFSGDVDIYARVNPAFAGVSARTIGPMRMYRKTAVYDRVIDIDPGQAPIAGSRYQTLQAAFAYIDLNFVTNQHWQCRFIANATIDAQVAWGSPFASIAKRGQIVVDGNGFNVTLGQTSWTTTTQIRPGLNSLVWKNLKVDFANMLQYYVENGYKLAVFRNCEIFSSSGAGELPGNGGQGIGKAPRPNPVFRDFVSLEACYVHDLDSEGFSCLAQVGNRIEDISGDASQQNGTNRGPYTIVGNRYKRISGSPLCNRLPVIQIAYSGGGTPTIDITGGQDTNARAIVLKVNGSTVKTCTASTTVGSGNYNCQDAVNDINAFATGWSATLLDNTRRYALIGHSSVGITATAAGLALPCTISAAVDAHTDGVQMNPSVTHENTLVLNNTYVDCQAQMKFWATDAAVWNCADIQNGRESMAVGALDPVTTLQSMNSGVFNHCLDVQNSNVNQRWTLIRSATATFDSYSRFIGNIAPKFDMTASGQTPWDLMAFGNLAFTAPGNALTGTNVTTPVVAGNAVDSFPQVNSAGFGPNDFIPAVGQSVRANQHTTQLPYDIYGIARGANCPPGISA